MHTARLGIGALVLLACSWVVLMQPADANQNAHLALVKSLADGTARVDRYRNETGDVSYIDGHYYAAKAPGLALTVLPAYLVLEAAGLAVENPAADRPYPQAMLEMPPSAVWQLGLFGTVLPGLVLLVLVRRVAERLVPGFGTAAAIVLGAGTLLAILATMFFAHALSACLGFAAFAVLVRERSGAADRRLVAAGGLLAGLAIVVELPVGIVAVVLGLYAAWRRDWPGRAVAYTAGVVAGLLPLAIFNTWAFGAPTRLSYVNAVIDPGVSGHDVVGANASGFFGVEVPSPRVLLELLLSSKGLLVLSPVTAMAAAGVWELYRRGARAEALVIGAVGGGFLLYNAAYYQPFGGFQAGPRFLVAMLPFVAVAVAAAWSAFPAATLALALASLVVTTVQLVADPFHASEDAGTWFHRLFRGEVTETVFGRLGLGDALGIALVLLLVTVAVAITIALTPGPRVGARSAVVALVALLCWRVVYVGGPVLLEIGSATGSWAAAGLAIAAPLCVVATVRGGPVAALSIVPLLPLARAEVAAHAGLALLGIGVSLAVALLFVSWPRRGGNVAHAT